MMADFPGAVLHRKFPPPYQISLPANHAVSSVVQLDWITRSALRPRSEMQWECKAAGC